MADTIDQSTTMLYDADEHAWIERQIAALRDGDFDRLDRANLVAYLTDMAARDRHELGSRLIVLHAHILKSRIQPEKARESWRLTIREQQRAIRRLLKNLPSLKHSADEILRDVYPDAVELAFDEMGKLRGPEHASWSEPDLDLARVLDFRIDKYGSGLKAQSIDVGLLLRRKIRLNITERRGKHRPRDYDSHTRC